MKPVVPVDCDPGCDRRNHQRDDGFIPAEDTIEATRHQDGVSDVKADEREERAD